ncbi:MAG: site-specific integrase [[Clostridium] fimetarium]|nr:site-specific integrase [Alistipes timonensis]MCM1405588.1 site-specific integrase [[Clostridium] fimetarium]
MASIKVIFRAPSVNGGEGTLYYRVIHKRVTRLIHTGIRVAREEWDADRHSIVIAARCPRREYLRRAAVTLEENMARLERVIARLDGSGREYTAADVAASYHRPDTAAGFISFARGLIDECRRVGKVSAAEHYSSALNSLMRFRGDAELAFEAFDSALLMAYECHLRAGNLTPNTTSYYMRKLRAIYNRAVDRGLTPQRNPFRKVYTGVAKTKKRAVTLDVLRALRDMDLAVDPMSELARDIFLFSFYTRGMAMVDIAYLRKSDLRDGILSYRRRKTNQQLHIRWETKMQEIVEHYGADDSEFLLPLIKSTEADCRRQYLNASHMINRRLKQLGARLGMAEPLTMYRARHAWASIALANNVPVSVISQGMGHDSEKTTRIYLASLNAAVIDNANNCIMRLLD